MGRSVDGDLVGGGQSAAGSAGRSKKVLAAAHAPLRAPEKRSLRLRLLGGLMVWVSTVYCGPKTRQGKGRGTEGSGLYPELGAFEISEGVSPALSSEVARQTVLLPSFELTRRELSRHGVDLNIKVIHRITHQLGKEVLSTRKRDLIAWWEGCVPAGRELAGKRVGVGIDGGRLRLRECRRP